MTFFQRDPRFSTREIVLTGLVVVALVSIVAFLIEDQDVRFAVSLTIVGAAAVLWKVEDVRRR